MKEKAKKENKKPMSRGAKIGLITAGAVVAGVGAFAVWKIFFSGDGTSKTYEDETVPYEPPVDTTTVHTSSYTPSTSAPSRNDEFPIKKGSKGEKVRAIQNALIQRYGSSALPRYGADGDFGSEMENALRSNGWPTVIDENTYNVLAVGPGINASDIAKKLYNAVTGKNYSDALNALKQMRNVDDYKTVSTRFKTYSIGGVSYTIVNAVLTKFTDSTQKENFRKEFLRMGLKYDGNKWSLSGLLEKPALLTLHNTVVWDFPDKRIPVDENVILGYPIETKKGYTLFVTLDGNRKLLVKEKSVRLIQQD